MTICQLKAINTLIPIKPTGERDNVGRPRPDPTHHLIPQNTPGPKTGPTSDRDPTKTRLCPSSHR